MFRRYFLAVLVGLMLILTGCTSAGTTTIKGSGTLKTEERPVQGFERIEIQNFGSASIHFADTEALTVEADDNLFQYLVVEVSGGTLKIGVQDNLSLSDVTLNFTITTKALTGLAINGAGSIEASDINTGSLNVSLKGTGSFNLAGNADFQTINLDGGGSFKGNGLSGKEAVVVISGAAGVDLNVSDKLDVTINGAGSVMYTGNPEVKQNISGTGSIQKIDS